MSRNYVVVFRYRNFLRSLFSYPRFIYCETWEEVEKLIEENGAKYRSEIDCIGDIKI